MAISLQQPTSNHLDLALPIKRDFVPLVDRCLADTERPSQRGLCSEELNGGGFVHSAVSMAWHTKQGKDARPIFAYAQGMSTITDRITQCYNELRLASGMTQVDLARIVGVSKQTVGDWLLGRSTNIRPDHLVALADAFGVEIRWLATGKGPRVPAPSRPQHDPEIDDAADNLTRVPFPQRTALITLINTSARP